MKRYFRDVPVDCWLHSRLGTSSRSICLQAGPEGCDVLLRAADEIVQDGVPAKRKLTLKPSDRKRPCTAIQLCLSPQTEQLKDMYLRREGQTAILEFTPPTFPQFIEAIQALKEGGEDWCISPEWSDKKSRKQLGEFDRLSLELWFWTPYMDP